MSKKVFFSWRIGGHCSVLSHHCVELQVRDNDRKRYNVENFHSKIYSEENVWWRYKIFVPYHQIHLWQFGLVDGWQWQWRSVCSSLHFKVCTQDEWKWELVIDMQKKWNSGREENIFFLYTLLPNRITTKKYSDQGGGWAASAQKQLFGETFKLMPLLLCSANQTPPSHTDHTSIWSDGNSELQKAADLAYFPPKLC